MKCSRADNINYMKPLHNIATVMLLVPPDTIAAGFSLTGYRILSALLIIMLIVVYVVSLYGKITVVYLVLFPTTIFLDVISQFLLLSSMINAIFRATFLNMYDFDLIKKLFKEIDKSVGQKTARKRTYTFWIEIVLSHIFIVLLIVFDVITTFRTLGKWFIFFIVREVSVYYGMIMVLLIYNYSLCVKLRLQKMNDVLIHTATVLSQRIQQETNQNGNTSTTISSSNSDDKKESLSISEIRIIFNKTSSTVTVLNKIFGSQILLFMITVSVGLLEFVNASILTLTDGEPALIPIVASEYEVSALSFIWCISFMIMGVSVTMTCDITSKEAQRTATICYNFLLDVPAFSNVQDQILREELILLAQQATNQCPRFSAAGFFNVDRTILLGLFATVTSYTIVLIQINKERYNDIKVNARRKKSGGKLDKGVSFHNVVRRRFQELFQRDPPSRLTMYRLFDTLPLSFLQVFSLLALTIFLTLYLRKRKN